MKLPVIIIGAGGHAKVLIDALLVNAISIIGITDSKPEKADSKILGIPIIGCDEVIQQYPPMSVELVNGVGAVKTTKQRKRIFEDYKKRGYNFATVIHPSASIAKDADLSEGVQIMAGAIIQTGSAIGENTIVNTGVIIDHDCRIGAHVHLATGSTLSGGVQVGESVLVGSSATVIQYLKIGGSALIAAGAVVVNDIPAGAVAMGVPARVT